MRFLQTFHSCVTHWPSLMMKWRHFPAPPAFARKDCQVSTSRGAFSATVSHRGCRRGAARFPVDLSSVSVTRQIIGSAPTDGNDQHRLCLADVSETGHRVPAARVDRGQMPCMGCDRHPPWLHRGERCGGGRLQEGWICDDEAVHAAISGLSGAAIGRAAQVTLSHMRYAICALQYLRRSI
jgi:hypothetical protein